MSAHRTLLAVFAHPDDESFGPGGTLARYAAQGADVHVVIATDGSAGSVEASHQSTEGVALQETRASELSNAAVALGISTVWSLPYRDSGMRGAAENRAPDALIQQPLAQLTAELAGYLERLQPDVLLTHDPFGGYGHPDHIRCCEAATAAFHVVRARNSAHAPAKLYYTAFDKRLLQLVIPLMKLAGKDPSALGRNQDIDLVEIARWRTPVTTRINVDAYLPRKLAASQAHASQYSGGPFFLRVLPPFIRRKFAATETFTLIYPARTESTESDLFAGL